ncbi:FliH/SctL family protein [Planctomyces sp. SH-PL14]|uniref:FliH/SctL family protein n=1 Tax=Planctomyces sp. SH-PL14 TaxID=1632864 RepID=UPI0009468532|nr:FliH/SctL family protein [Planctomyces sp. SH-PL14]
MFRYTLSTSTPLRQIQVRVADGDLDVAATSAPPPPPPPPPPPVAPPPTEDLRPLLMGLEETVREFEERRQQSLGELQQLAVELAVAVASHVIAKAVEAEQFDVTGLVQRLIDRLGLEAPLRVSLHPRDLQLFNAQIARDPATWKDRQLTLIPDPSLPRGSCRGEAPQGSVLSDASLHLAELRRHLLEGLDDAEIERRQAAPTDRGLRRFPDRRETA